ncbi:hypothetical protein [Lactococcus lactis]|uniref:hypothetical protein n=1 Tax=Lactococcus lactis TaxID=1358 RepID=UPI001F5727DA|nr:hypothetical protein [Lactococcus lactis]
MFKRKKFMALCATTLAGLSVLGSFAPMAAFADVAKAGDTVVTYEGAPKPAEWGLSVPSTVKLDEGTSNAGQSGIFTSKNCKLSIIKEDGTDYTDTQDKTFNINGSVENAGKLIGTKDTSIKVDLNVYISKVGDSNEKEDTFVGYGISGSTLKDQNIEATYKADGSQKAERYVKLYAATQQLQSVTKDGENLQTSVSWTATEKTS